MRRPLWRCNQRERVSCKNLLEHASVKQNILRVYYMGITLNRIETRHPRTHRGQPHST